jgi:hypothetical protein
LLIAPVEKDAHGSPRPRLRYVEAGDLESTAIRFDGMDVDDSH